MGTSKGRPNWPSVGLSRSGDPELPNRWSRQSVSQHPAAQIFCQSCLQPCTPEQRSEVVDFRRGSGQAGGSRSDRGGRQADWSRPLLGLSRPQVRAYGDGPRRTARGDLSSRTGFTAKTVESGLASRSPAQGRESASSRRCTNERSANPALWPKNRGPF